MLKQVQTQVLHCQRNCCLFFPEDGSSVPTGSEEVQYIYNKSMSVGDFLDQVEAETLPTNKRKSLILSY